MTFDPGSTSGEGRIFLWGPMGAGKTAVGRELSSRWGRQLVDLDAAIEADAGRSVAEIFEQRGEAAFRALERAKLEPLLATDGNEIVALGGGSLLDPTLRLAALRAGVVVTLTASVDALAGRIGDAGARPLLRRTGGSLAEQLQRLLRERAGAYAATHLTIDTSDCSAVEVARALETSLGRGVVPLTVSSDIAYSLRRADGAAAAASGDVLQSLRPSSIAIVSDDNVARLHLGAFVEALRARGFDVGSPIVLQSGEEAKRFDAVERVLSELIGAGCDRHSVVIGFGGGVVTDLAGFAASIFMRGVRWLAVPTTLLAMVDAAIGGKTGVNLAAAKNAVGSFHHPAAVVIDTSFSATESDRAAMSGLAEVVKVAAVRDAALFATLEREAPKLRAREPSVIARAVDGAIRIKAAVVSEDPSERGSRAILNFGHTLGHALEAASSYGTFAHGEAVAIGMVAATRVGVELGRSTAGVAARLIATLRSLALPTEVPESLMENALALLRLDKKRRAGELTLVVPDVLGGAVLLPLSVELCMSAFRRTLAALAATET